MASYTIVDEHHVKLSERLYDLILNPCNEIKLSFSSQCNLGQQESDGVIRKKKKKVIWCRSIDEPFEPAW